MLRQPAQVQASNQQWDDAARTQELGGNLSASALTRKSTKSSPSAQSAAEAVLARVLRPAISKKFQSSLMALGALSAFGAASYGVLRNQVRIQREREERERLQGGRIVGALVVVAVLVWMYTGWFYFLLLLNVGLPLLLCTLATIAKMAK